MHGFAQLFAIWSKLGKCRGGWTQTWLNDHFIDFIKKDEWPASSPDLNPLDYSIWSLLEADVNAEEHNSVESLKNAISEAFERLPMEVINQAVDNWMKRLDAVIKAKGGHFEWILMKFYVLLLFILLLLHRIKGDD